MEKYVSPLSLLLSVSAVPLWLVLFCALSLKTHSTRDARSAAFHDALDFRESRHRRVARRRHRQRAVNVIEQVADRYGDEVVVGAGTVLDAETARTCILAGATFVISPSLNLATIEMCRRYSVVVTPGALTPTEVVTAWASGADAVKIFPCSAMGGAKYLKSLKAPLPQVLMIPTGGVSLATAAEFIQAGAFALGVGADLVDTKAIREGQPEKVTEAARAYVAAVRDARGIGKSSAHG